MQAALDELDMDQPHLLLRQLRHYLSRQADHGRLRNLKEKAIELVTVSERSQELTCHYLRFKSGSELTFRIRLDQRHVGWFLKQFQFHVKLAQPRRVGMVRIHLDPENRFDPLSVPRCHLHVDNSRPHVPFPIISPRLILHLVCEHIEPDIGLDPE